MIVIGSSLINGKWVSDGLSNAWYAKATSKTFLDHVNLDNTKDIYLVQMRSLKSCNNNIFKILVEMLNSIITTLCRVLKLDKKKLEKHSMV